MKNFIAIICLCAYVMGAIGGFGYAVYEGAYPIAASIVILAIMAWPTAVNQWRVLNPE